MPPELRERHLLRKLPTRAAHSPSRDAAIHACTAARTLIKLARNLIDHDNEQDALAAKCG